MVVTGGAFPGMSFVTFRQYKSLLDLWRLSQFNLVSSSHPMMIYFWGTLTFVLTSIDPCEVFKIYFLSSFLKFECWKTYFTKHCEWSNMQTTYGLLAAVTSSWRGHGLTFCLTCAIGRCSLTSLSDIFISSQLSQKKNIKESNQNYFRLFFYFLFFLVDWQYVKLYNLWLILQSAGVAGGAYWKCTPGY